MCVLPQPHSNNTQGNNFLVTDNFSVKVLTSQGVLYDLVLANLPDSGG